MTARIHNTTKSEICNDSYKTSSNQPKNPPVQTDAERERMFSALAAVYAMCPTYQKRKAGK